MDTVKHSQAAKDAQDVLQAHASLAALEADERVARDSGPIGQLSLRETTELPPHDNVVRDVAKRAPKRWRQRFGGTGIFPL